MNFPRGQYYSQTELVKTFQISIKGAKQLITDGLVDVVTKDVDLGEYSVKALYYPKDVVDKLTLKKRIS